MVDKFNYNKNSKVIVIPNGTKAISDYAFKDFENLEEIILPSSIEQIGKSAFENCKSLKKINIPEGLQIINESIFKNCESLEEITIPNSLHYISANMFFNCYNLKKINIHDNIKYIEDFAFENCSSIKEFKMPNNLTSVGKNAFMRCNSIKEINIPKKVKTIDIGAFSLMESLEKITVDEENDRCLALNNNSVLVSKSGLILQYAIASDNEEFIVGYYQDTFSNDNPFLSNFLIYNIADYAFAGAKKLKKIAINSELESIGPNTFKDCDNLKDLEIFHTNFGDSFLIFIPKNSITRTYIPFENITIEEGVKTLCNDLHPLFKNAKNIKLPTSLENINNDVFSESTNLKKLNIPENIKSISPNTFYKDIELNFKNYGTFKAKDFNMIQTKTDLDGFTKNNRDNIRIFSLNDGTYYVKINNFDTIEINRNDIVNLSNTSKELADNPNKVIDYIINLLSINSEYDRILSNVWSDPKLEKLFSKFAIDSNYAEDIAKNKLSKIIKEIMESSGLYDEFLFNHMIMGKLNISETTKLIKNYNNYLKILFTKAANVYDKIDVDKLINYCNLLKKYNVKDRFLFNPQLALEADYENQKLLIKYFNKNIKNMIVRSKVLDITNTPNLNDLLNFSKVFGVFSENQRLSQKVTTFTIEKLMDYNSRVSLVGNNIHTLFSSLDPRDEIDYEFIIFFLDNYKKLLNSELENTGITAKIYNNFRNISNTSTSHKGSQRHLKVTLEKCNDYFISKKFNGVTEENKELAYFLQKHYSEQYALTIAEKILEECKNAPRNIFSKSNDPKEDLKEKNSSDYTYDWLPKQDYSNLVLGKYCSCCAHMLGAGAGIMRASMTLDNCQNLVIRNKEDKIIAKMTIYVNKNAGYAVFNTTEVNLAYHDKDSIKKIYNAFMRGVNAFIKKYNENYKNKIKIITIGEHRNLIKDNLGNIETNILEAPNYSKYGYTIENKNFGEYNGDSNNKQILVLKKKSN